MDATIVTLLIVGVLLLLAETVLPGMIAGVVGGLCLVAAVVLSYTNYGARTGTGVLLGVLAGAVLGTVLWFRYFPDSRMARPLVSSRTIGDVGAERPELLNLTGQALTTLRPSGTALINGQRVDVVTEGSMIESGSSVRVVAVEGLRTVVRAI